MAALTPTFSTGRTVRQYTEEQYISAARAYALRACGDGELTASFLAWREDIARNWQDVHFGAVRCTEQDGELIFQVEVFLGRLNLDSVRVELYAEPLEGEPPLNATMQRTERAVQESGAYVYEKRIPATRPASDFTPRVVPFHLLALPTEIRQMRWQR
jgi:starch phosphorylase